MVNVQFFARSATIVVVSALVALAGHASTVIAQERQGCFMVEPGRQVIGLEDICPTPPPFLIMGPSEASLGTGDIQVTLRWATTDDVDLAVTGPDGQRIFWENPGPSGTGGILDRDDNSSCEVMTQSPIENVYWPTGQAPDGDYSIEVSLFQRCAVSIEPINFEVRLLVQGTTETLTGSVSESSPTFTHSFSVPLQTP
ncbi:MAG: hypothetical protein AAGD25_24605 [Cyanobacteria bacterium P01_F01_bin.150]